MVIYTYIISTISSNNNILKNIIWILLLGSLFVSCQNRESTSPAVYQHSKHIPKNQLESIQEGDIVLKRGVSPLSEVIIQELKEPVPLSHCGIVVQEGGEWFVIHAYAKEVRGFDGVQKTLLDRFMSDSHVNSIYFVRHKDSHKYRKHIVESAKEYLKRGVPFDYQFDSMDHTKVYCSELVHVIFKDVTGKEILSKKQVGNNAIYTFNSFLRAEHFNVVLNL